MKHAARPGANFQKSRHVPGPLHAVLLAALSWTAGSGCGGRVLVDCSDPPCPEIGGGTGDPCEQSLQTLEAKYVACGIELGPSVDEPVECTQELAAQYSCVTQCVGAASCEALNGVDADATVAFAECLGDC
jgi:hypothetical protein